MRSAVSNFNYREREREWVREREREKFSPFLLSSFPGHSAGISKKTVKLRPIAVIKGWGQIEEIPAIWAKCRSCLFHRGRRSQNCFRSSLPLSQRVLGESSWREPRVRTMPRQSCEFQDKLLHFEVNIKYCRLVTVILNLVTALSRLLSCNLHSRNFRLKNYPAVLHKLPINVTNINMTMWSSFHSDV